MIGNLLSLRSLIEETLRQLYSTGLCLGTYSQRRANRGFGLIQPTDDSLILTE